MGPGNPLSVSTAPFLSRNSEFPQPHVSKHGLSSCLTPEKEKEQRKQETKKDNEKVHGLTSKPCLTTNRPERAAEIGTYKKTNHIIKRYKPQLPTSPRQPAQSFSLPICPLATSYPPQNQTAPLPIQFTHAHHSPPSIQTSNPNPV